MTATADVTVIGAGVIGAAVSYELSKRGLHVQVIERKIPNREGSGTTAGNLHIQGIHTRRPGQQIPVNSARFLPLQRAASDLWNEVEDDLGTSVEVRRTGGFMIAETDSEVAQLHEKAIGERSVGIPTEILDGDAARSAMPQLGRTVSAASWCGWDGYANPLLVGPAYLSAAGRLGADVLLGSPVTSIRALSEGWRVVAGDTEVHTKWIINTAGPWISAVAALAGMTIQMTPVAIQMHVTVRLPALLPHLVQHIGQGLSVKQVVAGNILIGGGWPAQSLNLEGRSPASLASMIGNVEQAVRIIPALRRASLLRMWAGPLAATPDEMPVIGQLPGVPNCLIAGGTYAFTFAPLWARVLAAAVMGEASPLDVSDLGPQRLLKPVTQSPDTRPVEQRTPARTIHE
ncbi:MAG: FAD-binding oxidoreductase [Propionicimonas sp.]|nr:FAD-binding oxidoreductase [Propionicimonas sp.]